MHKFRFVSKVSRNGIEITETGREEGYFFSVKELKQYLGSQVVSYADGVLSFVYPDAILGDRVSNERGRLFEHEHVYGVSMRLDLACDVCYFKAKSLTDLVQSWVSKFKLLYSIDTTSCIAVEDTPYNEVILHDISAYLSMEFANGGIISFTIPDFITSVSEYCFCGMHGLQRVTFNGGLQTIGGRAFASCISLANKTIILPSSCVCTDDAFCHIDNLSILCEDIDDSFSLCK